jgi:protein gp37
MAHNSAIEWTGSTWNPVVGCSKVSTGCLNCYAERMARRLAAMAASARKRGKRPGRTANYEHVVDGNGQWNGHVYLDTDAVKDPLAWKRPRTVFVNSMSDLFHEEVPFDFVRQMFDVMNRCPQHTFQMLTKRPHRTARVASRLNWTSNIWMGTSVENEAVSERIDALRSVPAAVRFLSLEPLLGPLTDLDLDGIHWVIVGGESGPRARPMEPYWATDIRDQCVRQAVPFFFKQWGGVNKKKAGRRLGGRTWNGMPDMHRERQRSKTRKVHSFLSGMSVS